MRSSARSLGACIMSRYGTLAICKPRDLMKTEDQKVGIAGRGGGIELARLRARQRHELVYGADIERRRDRDRQHGHVDLRDRRDIAQIVAGLLLIKEVDEEDRGRAEEQHVIVACADKSIQRDQAVAAG